MNIWLPRGGAHTNPFKMGRYSQFYPFPVLLSFVLHQALVVQFIPPSSSSARHIFKKAIGLAVRYPYVQCMFRTQYVQYMSEIIISLRRP